MYKLKATIQAIFLVMLLVIPQYSVQSAEKNVYDHLKLFGDVFELVQSEYVVETDGLKLINAAISGMLASLDPHSGFMDGESYKEMQERTSGQFGGLGIEVRMEEGAGVRVIRPMEETPAMRAGVQAGDLITHIDDRSLSSMSLQEAVEIMRGPVDSTIDLTISRVGEDDPLTLTLVRAVIRLPSVMFRAEETAAYIQITSFSEQTEFGIRKAMSELKEEMGEKLEGVIIDVRNNPGGLLDQSVAAVDAFLDRGEVVVTRGRNRNDIQRYTARRGDLADGMPLIVLINGGSASASEIVAGALQDHKRAIIIGTQSFGKGSVQTIMPMGQYGAMRLTTSRYYTPSGRSIQATGITPDIIIEQAEIEPLFPQPEEESASEEAPTPSSLRKDYQLERARELIHALSINQRETATN